MELFASAPGLAVEESYVRLLNHLPGLAYRCRVGRTDPIVSERLEYTLEFVSKGSASPPRTWYGTTTIPSSA